MPLQHNLNISGDEPSERIVNKASLGRALTLKTLILGAFAAISLISTGLAQSKPSTYQTPPHNYYQNNWLAGGGG
jgi:hypothetical protein